MGQAARAHLESLLRTRKLDVTLTSPLDSLALARGRAARDVASTGLVMLDTALGGGLTRGNLSEVVGPRSSGRTTILCGALAAAAERGEAVALIDTHDRFDPISAEATGLDLSKLLWVRDTGDAARALKAANLVLQAGGFGLVAFDLADAPGRIVRQFPHTTWMRIARTIEGSQTVALIVGAEHIARSPGGATIALDASSARWSGASDRARRLDGVDVRPRVINGVKV
jgi:recombination protein RecA